MLKGAARLVARGLLRLLSRGDDRARFRSTLPRGAFGDGRASPADALATPLRMAASLDDVVWQLAAFAKVGGREAGFGGGSAGQAAAALDAEGRGNCVAHASWAFAQLARLGYDPELVVGRWTAAGAPAGEFHAWVQFEREGVPMLLETMAPDAALALRPLAEVRAGYLPLYAAAASGATYTYAAFVRARLSE